MTSKDSQSLERTAQYAVTWCSESSEGSEERFTFKGLSRLWIGADFWRQKNGSEVKLEGRTLNLPEGQHEKITITVRKMGSSKSTVKSKRKAPAPISKPAKISSIEEPAKKKSRMPTGELGVGTTMPSHGKSLQHLHLCDDYRDCPILCNPYVNAHRYSF